MSTTDPQVPMPDWRVIDAYLVGQASAEQQAEVRRWMAVSPAHDVILRSMRDALAPAEAAKVDVDAAWTAVSRRVGLETPARPAAVIRQFPVRRSIWAVAAALILAVGIGVWQSNRRVELSAGTGERITRTLADGSVVTLNSGSRLRYPRRFSASREVELDGEALFQVTHDARHPFRVMANHAVATDLGTRFVVRAYTELGRVDVAVIEGRVSLKGDGKNRDSLVIGAGTTGHVRADGALSTDRSVPANMTAWVDGILAFNATPLADVAAELRRKFGLPIRFADSATAARRVSTSFRNETLPQILDAVTLALGLTYERSNDTVVLSSGSNR